MAENWRDCSRLVIFLDLDVTTVGQPLPFEAVDQYSLSLEISLSVLLGEALHFHPIPLPVPSSAASIKLLIDGKENLAALASSTGGDGGLCTRRVYEYSFEDNLEYLADMLQRNGMVKMIRKSKGKQLIRSYYSRLYMCPFLEEDFLEGLGEGKSQLPAENNGGMLKDKASCAN